mgnify:CR=1 FL=1
MMTKFCILFKNGWELILQVCTGDIAKEWNKDGCVEKSFAKSLGIPTTNVASIVVHSSNRKHMKACYRQQQAKR